MDGWDGQIWICGADQMQLRYDLFIYYFCIFLYWIFSASSRSSPPIFFNEVLWHLLYQFWFNITKCIHRCACSLSLMLQPRSFSSISDNLGTCWPWTSSTHIFLCPNDNSNMLQPWALGIWCTLFLIQFFDACPF